ncbi:MAG: glycoside hydrolase family 99-like domain-containing protein [Pirellulaceae bacterium]
MKWTAAAVLVCITAGFSRLVADELTALKQDREYTVAVYYWPNFHRDAYHQSKKGEDWTEWEIVKSAKPKFPGHDQSKRPLRGYRDESDPQEMARSIDAMADAGIGAIIFD